MRFTTPRLMIMALPFMLVACGDGWEAVRTDEIFPYGNQRTAGSGVMYVRAKMMPEKELKLTPASEKLEQQLYAPKTKYKPATDDNPVSVGEIEMPEDDAQAQKMAEQKQGMTKQDAPPTIEASSGENTVTIEAEPESYGHRNDILAPKNETYKPLSEGEKRLNEIYNDDPYTGR